MCGIAGWYRRGGRPVEPDIIVQQCDRIIHRGPDDSGYFTDGDFGFGMRRLSIIDLAGGHQPIFSADGRHAIVFNGEIYNHLDLRRELEAAGVTFRHAQRHRDAARQLGCIGATTAWLKLDGMYAVAIWDRAERQLTLARDPLGIKPLYLTEQHGGLAFASEIRALRVLPDHHFDLDERGVHDFFIFGHVQRPRSIYRQVRSLEPGHVLRIGPTGAAEIASVLAAALPCPPRPQRSAVDRGDARARAGDSRAAHAGRRTGRRLSVGRRRFQRHRRGDDPRCVGADQGVHRRLPRHLDRRDGRRRGGSPSISAREHIVLPLEPARAGDLLPAVQAAFDEPCAATAAVPIWHLSRLAAQHVKVVLCGEGSDEIFAGYKRQRTAPQGGAAAPAARARWVRWLRPSIALPDDLAESNYRWQKLRRRRASALLENGYQRFFAGTQISTPAVRERLYDAGFLPGRMATIDSCGWNANISAVPARARSTRWSSSCSPISPSTCRARCSTASIAAAWRIRWRRACRSFRTSSSTGA